jgi:hypothetical protein
VTQNTDQDDRPDESADNESADSESKKSSNEDSKTRSASADETEKQGADEQSTAQSQRKERVLHTRVPAVLEQELKRLAQSLRMPVSNVVRAILEDAVTAVDLVGRKAEGEMNRVVDRMAEKRERLRDIATGPKGKTSEATPVEKDEAEAPAAPAKESEAPAAEPPKDPKQQLEGVIGFQPLLLASSTSCSVCGIDLKVGSEAFVGVRDVPGPRVLIGPECLPKPEDNG